MIARLTMVEKAGAQPLSKRIFLDGAGQVRSDGSPCAMTTGIANRVELNGHPAEQLARLIGELPGNRALILGDLHPDLPDAVRLDVKRRARPEKGTVARTRDAFAYRRNEAAFALVDFDQKGMPLGVRQRLAAVGGLKHAIAGLLPGIGQAATVTRASTSSGIVNTVTGERHAGSGGMHLYILVRDGTDIPRILAALHQRAWLAGLGWITIGGAGQLLERSIVDRTVGAPERLVFEGAPAVVPPLSQDADARRPDFNEGGPLDSQAACPNLTRLEEDSYLAALRAAKEVLGPEAAAVRARWIAAAAEALAGERGIGLEAARAAVSARHDGVLLPADVVHFDDDELGRVAVADILADPAGYDGETLADPLEGRGYGLGKAKVLLAPAISALCAPTLVIHSFAHGGMVYRLRYDVAAVEAAIAKAGDKAPEVLAKLLPQAHDLNPVARERLRDAAARAAVVGKRTVDQLLKESFRRQATADAKRRAERDLEDLAAGGRAVLPLPADDAELTPTVLALDEVLGASTLPDPLVRDLAGGCCRVELRAPDGLHLLTSAGAAGEEDAEGRLAPPVEPLITPYKLPGLRLRIEREVAFYGQDDDGMIVVKALQPHFATAFAAFDGSQLPRIKGVVTAPLVLPSGRVLTGDGFDRASGLHFHIDPRLARLVPASVSEEDVQRAYRWLLEDLLPDVLTDDTGKAIAVAHMLTLIERLILDARPAFFVTANQRGGGKTTLVHMVTLAVLGRMAAASAWSPSAEERRKSVFAAFREGVAALNWDNIPRGEGVSCPHLEASLTSATVADRVLGVSQREQAAATTVQSFTGNNVLPAGDLASRSLVLVLESRRLDPENRAFAHPDPFAWVQANRTRIMRALYTLLMGNPLLGAAGEAHAAETRFKTWWRLCGHAVEHAARLHDPGSKLRFRDLFLQSEEEDEEATGTGDLLQALALAFKGRVFTSADVVSKINAADFSGECSTILDGLVRATRKSLKVVSSHTVGQRLKAIKDRPALVGERLLALKHAAKQKGGEQGKWRVTELGTFEEEL